jgi:hypothetical protein
VGGSIGASGMSPPGISGGKNHVNCLFFERLLISTALYIGHLEFHTKHKAVNKLSIKFASSDNL